MESLQDIIERTLAAMGYEMVDIEFAPRGVMRVFIDAPAGIRMEDCERVSHQLTHVLAVDDIDYERLEVSSPGLDRPLRKPEDFVRFAGSDVTVRLKRPFEGRRNFEGVLTVEEEGRFGLELVDESVQQAARGKPGIRPVKPSRPKPKTEPAPPRKLVFALDEVDRARLVPNVKF